MTDYFKILSDPTHSWLEDPDSPFRCWANKKEPYIQFNHRSLKRRLGYGSRKLKYPVAENPRLYVYKDGSRKGLVNSVEQATTERISPKQRFNWQIEKLICKWHEEARASGCDHEKPWLQMSSDCLGEMFSSVI
tara:strand:+ start:306 stop:707 length:402 start_codon:yes stop_codon:yes gene_type:complete